MNLKNKKKITLSLIFIFRSDSNQQRVPQQDIAQNEATGSSTLLLDFPGKWIHRFSLKLAPKLYKKDVDLLLGASSGSRGQLNVQLEY